MKTIVWIAVMSLMLSACGDKNHSSSAGEPNADIRIDEPVGAADMQINGDGNASYVANQKVDMVKFPPPIVKPDAEKQADIEKKIIKEGDISFETDNVNATRKNILSALKKIGGYVSEDNEALNSEDNRKQYVLLVHIPAQHFDGFLGTVSATATKIDTKNISVRDVTTEYIDTKTRLDNKKILEKRYLELLSKAGKMSDVLDIENKLSEIRSEIESNQGQLNYLNKQVAYSSLTITFYTKQAEQAVTGNSFGYKFKQALSNGLEFIQNLFFGIISIWPLWIIIVVMYLLVRKWARRRRKS